MRGILKESVRGALVRFFRLIIYILIILLITFIVGLIGGKKAKALTYKGLNQSLIDSPGNTRTGTLTPNSEVALDFVYTRPNDTTYDLIGFRIHDFSLSPQNYNNNNNESVSCTGTYNPSVAGYTNNMQWNCSGNITNFQNLMPNDFDISVYAFVFYDDNTSNFCWQSSEVQDTFLCPTVANHSITKVQFHFRANNVSNWYYRFQTSNNLAYYNYDSTDIINSNGIIINQQQQTNDNLENIQEQQEQQQQYLEDDDTSSSSSTMQGGVSDLTTSINSKLGSVNDLTQVVLLPITLFMDLQTDTCQPLHLVVPFTNNDVYLPCMTPIYQEHFGPLLTLFQTVIGGITGYWLAINIGKLIKEIVDCDNDRIEVLDL